MKIERVTHIWIFEQPEMAKNKILDFSGPTCVS